MVDPAKIVNSSLTRVRGAALPVAFAASLAIHVSTFAVLVGMDGGPRMTTRALPERAAMLEARLVAITPEIVPIPDQPAIEAARTAIDATAPSPGLPSGSGIAKPSPGAAAEKPSPLGFAPRIVINDRVPRARFGGAFDGDELAEFPIEIDAAVVVPDKFEIPYPQSALAARKEGTVLAWAVIDEQGAVEATHITEGEPEFAEAVESALAKTRFIPAHDLGKTLRYYITLEFEFRIETTGAVADVGTNATSPR